jgi:hypothetical protein
LQPLHPLDFFSNTLIVSGNCQTFPLENTAKDFTSKSTPKKYLLFGVLTGLTSILNEINQLIACQEIVTVLGKVTIYCAPSHQ